MFGHFILLLFLVEDILSLTDFLAQPYYCYWLLPFPFHIEKRGKSSKRFVSTLIYRRYANIFLCTSRCNCRQTNANVCQFPNVWFKLELDNSTEWPMKCMILFLCLFRYLGLGFTFKWAKINVINSRREK